MNDIELKNSGFGWFCGLFYFFLLFNIIQKIQKMTEKTKDLLLHEAQFLVIISR